MSTRQLSPQDIERLESRYMPSRSATEARLPVEDFLSLVATAKFGYTLPDDKASVEASINKTWTKLLEVLEGHPNKAEILGAIHVLRVDQHIRGRLLQQEYGANPTVPTKNR